MKQLFYKLGLLSIIMLFPTLMSSQNAFLPILKQGRSWKIACKDENGNSEILTMTVAGDTLVNDRNCKKIKVAALEGSNSIFTIVAFEEEGKVWSVEDGTFSQLFDMSLNEGDAVDAGYVLKSDVINVNGVKRKRLTIDSGIDCDDYVFYVVEGIGISTDRFLYNASIFGEGKFGTMLSCMDGDECIFTENDFRTASADGNKPLFYDLNGDGLMDVDDVNALINYILSKQ